MREGRIFYGWWIVVACTIISSWTGGIFYCMTAFFKPIADEFGWSYSVVSFGMGLRSLEIGLLAPVAGILVDRRGPKPVVMAATVLTCLGLLLLSRIDSVASFYFAFILLSCGISGVGQITVTGALAQWFRRKIGIATGITIAGYGFGGVLIPPAVWLISRYGWRASLAIFAVVTVIVFTPAGLLMRHKPEPYGLLPDGETSAKVAADRALRVGEADFTTLQALSSVSFWLLGIATAIQFSVASTVNIHIIPYLSAYLSDASAGFVAMLLTITSVSGRFVFGWLADRFDKRLLLGANFLLQTLSIGCICLPHGPAQLIAFVILFGPSWGGINTVRSVIVRDYFGRSSYATIYGIQVALVNVGSIAGPVYAGLIFDATRSYQLTWITYLACLLVATPMIFLAKKKQAPVTFSAA